TDFGGKTSIFSHPVYLFLRKFSLQDSRGGSESAIAVRLSSAFETLCAYCAENMIDTPRDFMAGLVCQLESTARSLRSTFDLPDEPTGNAAPSWLTEPTPQINGLEA
ncbi:hypothetical protein H000_01598, partial [Escherichia coli UMEA 3899-1]